jgi:hypothetical protein
LFLAELGPLRRIGFRGSDSFFFVVSQALRRRAKSSGR